MAESTTACEATTSSVSPTGRPKAANVDTAAGLRKAFGSGVWPVCPLGHPPGGAKSTRV